MATTTTSTITLEPTLAVDTLEDNARHSLHSNRLASSSAALETEPASSLSRTIPGQPQEALEVEESTPVDASTSEDVVYPSGAKLWAIMASNLTVSALFGLDATIVATAVPSITNHFKTIGDLGWYLAA